MTLKAALIVLMGPPGSGKGTQAKSLAAKHLGWIHISTGDLFRTEISSGSALGNSVKDILARGELVSDQVTNQVFESQMLQIMKKSPSVLILDGYPRTAPQGTYLMDFYKRHSTVLTDPIALEFQIKQENVVNRLADRLINPRSGRIYHRITNPPKVAMVDDTDGGPLVQRPDDQPETIRSRFKLYMDQRDQILKAMGKQAQVEQVQAEALPQEVALDLEKRIEGYLKKA